MRFQRIEVRAAVALLFLFAPVAAGETPATQPATAPATQPVPRPPLKLGALLMDVSQQADGARQVRNFGGNLVINGVMAKSRGQEMGLRRRDVIKRINGQEMKTVQDVIDAVQTGKLLEIEILRDKEPMTLRERPNIT
jgi:S1-C subfamily serine protease